MLALLTLMTSATKITLYTHTACPFAQRVWIALEHTQVEFVRQDVNLYGSGGFDKRALKQVEERGGLLPPKGYIPMLAIGEDLFRESDHCVRHRVGTQGQSVCLSVCLSLTVCRNAPSWRCFRRKELSAPHRVTVSSFC